MSFTNSINNISEQFEKIGLKLLNIEDLGMHKYAEFSTDNFNIYFSYDRGGIELVAALDNKKRFDIIQLVNWLKSDKEKYKHPDLFKTSDSEKINYNGNVLITEFKLIKGFLENATETEFKSFENNQKFEGAKYWSKVYKDKGKSIPENLKKILKDNRQL